MTTFADIVEETLSLLRGYVRSQEQSTYLVSDVTSSGLTWSVGDASRLGSGRVECGSEIIYIDSADETANSVTIAPYGRGMDGTTAAAHVTNVEIKSNPKFPRFSVKRAINDTITCLAGDLFAVESTEVVTSTTVAAYEIPEDAIGVLQVLLEATDGQWEQVKMWRFDQSTNATDFPSGKAIVTGRVWGEGGRTLRVVYAVDPTPLSADTDSFTSVSGLSDACRDIVVFGAAWRLLSSVDPSMLDTESISSADLGGQQQKVGTATQLSQQMYLMFTKRAAEERRKLQRRYPAATHDTGIW